MVMQASYKNKRGKRLASLDNNYSLGMQWTEGPVDEGFAKCIVNFDYANNNTVLKPRAALTTEEYLFPNTVAQHAPFIGSALRINAAKECVEHNKVYRQFIASTSGSKEGNLPYEIGATYIGTSTKEANTTVANEDKVLKYNEIRWLLTNSLPPFPKTVYCLTTSDTVDELHNVVLSESMVNSRVIGTFGPNNNFYYLAWKTEDLLEDEDEHPSLARTVFNEETETYEYEYMDAYVPSASEAVTYGYNMLLDTPYVFTDKYEGNVFDMQGILPYKASDGTTLNMSPKVNETVLLRLNYSVPQNSRYKVEWEWKTLEGESWSKIPTSQSEYDFSTATPPDITAFFKAPAEALMVRVSAYNLDSEYSDTVEKVMTVGFDFTEAGKLNNSNVTPENYDLYSCRDMLYWDNRLVIWGVAKDPTILFISDLNEPTYFPYPNNVTTFDEPIVTVKEFMGKLAVFTTSKIYLVESTDGASWTTTVVQTNLHFKFSDRRLIQVVRNMLYFKSGDYYYMMVPKAQTLTGELVLAPISSNITDFLNNFSVNFDSILYETYGSRINYRFVDHFNYLDYESVHNVYVVKLSSHSYIHFDLEYNTVTRYWKINIYFTESILTPYNTDATKVGSLISTSVRLFRTSNSVFIGGRVVQIYKFDSSQAKDYYIPGQTSAAIRYDKSYTGATYAAGNLTLPSGSVADFDLKLDGVKVSTDNITFASTTDYYNGFKVTDIEQVIKEVLSNPEEYIFYQNWQYLDTGFRTDNLHYNKRYRELQLEINNVDYSDLEFGMDFIIDGEYRKTVFKYEVSQIVDLFDRSYNVAFVDLVPHMEVPSDEIIRDNYWTIKHNIDNKIKLWKVRANISGKGTAPRLKLYSRNCVRYELLGINWIYRVMNMR